MSPSVSLETVVEEVRGELDLVVQRLVREAAMKLQKDVKFDYVNYYNGNYFTGLPDPPAVNYYMREYLTSRQENTRIAWRNHLIVEIQHLKLKEREFLHLSSMHQMNKFVAEKCCKAYSEMESVLALLEPTPRPPVVFEMQCSSESEDDKCPAYVGGLFEYMTQENF